MNEHSSALVSIYVNLNKTQQKKYSKLEGVFSGRPNTTEFFSRCPCVGEKISGLFFGEDSKSIQLIAKALGCESSELIFTVKSVEHFRQNEQWVLGTDDFDQDHDACLDVTVSVLNLSF